MQMQKRVLVVDDSYINRQVLYKILSPQYTVLQAENGADALKQLQCSNEEIDAVILDLIMPQMDGYDFLEHCRKTQKLAGVPVLITTQNEDEDTEVRALALGAADFLTKPYKPAVIRQRVANVIRLHEAAALINNVERDALTGMYSRDFFYRNAAQLLRENPPGTFDIICADIEKFKLVNDLFGVSEGDRLLKHMANVLTEILKENSLCGRLGDDNFAALVHHRDTYSSPIFERIVALLNEYPLSINLVARFGIYTVQDLTLSVSTMTDRACLAIESIKGKYDVYYAYYDDSLRDKMLFEQGVVNSMEQALAENQFQVYYQPKYDLTTREVVGAEALVRWVHPEKGFMSPAQFIPLFERNGFITDLDMFVWEKTCAHMRAWMDAGHTPVPVSVNISRVDIYNPGLVAFLRRTLQTYGLAPQMLHLEITETAYTESPQQLISVVTELKQMGFIIEMDDFGTGYSSLNMLSELPIDMLKLDMHFLHDKKKTNNNENILRFIVNLAKWLGLALVAEGIETEEQLLMLRNMGTEYGQGYYFSKPLPQGEFEALLRSAPIAPLPQQQSSWQQAQAGCAINRLYTVIAAGHPQHTDALCALLKGGCTVLPAGGAEAVMALLMDGERHVDGLLLDCAADPAYGFALLQQLYRNAVPQHVPVVVLGTSAVSAQQDARAANAPAAETQARNLGAADYIAMPADGKTVLQHLSSAIMYACMESARQMQRQRAEIDTLTGLLSCTAFEERAEALLHKGERTENVALLLVQLEGLEQLNTTQGCQAGDEAVEQAAKLLSRCFRANDMVGRLKGDLFGVIMPGFGTPEDLFCRMEALRCQLQAAFGEDKPECSIHCVMGAALESLQEKNYAQLAAGAQQALQEARQDGGGYRLFGAPAPQLSAQVRQTLDWLLDETSDGILVRDAQTHEILYVNEPATQLTRCGKQDSLGKKCHKLIWGRDTPCPNCRVQHENSPAFVQQQLYRPETNQHFNVKSKPIQWKGRSAYLHCVQDETLRQQELSDRNSLMSVTLSQQQALVEELNDVTCRLQTVLENLAGGIVILHADGEGRVKPTYFSSGFCQMLQATQAELRALYGNDMLQCVWPQDAWRVSRLFRTAVPARQKMSDVFRLRCHNGQCVWVSMNANVFAGEQGSLTYYVLFTDITQEHQAREQARRSDEENRTKSLFLSALSHDVRTPMNAILGVTQLARAEIENKDTLMESLSVIEGSVGHLLNIINEVLEAADLGTAAVQPVQPASLAAELRLLQTVLRPTLQQKQQNLVIKLDLQHEWFQMESMQIHRLCLRILSALCQAAPQEAVLRLCVQESPHSDGKESTVRLKIDSETEGVMPSEMQQAVQSPLPSQAAHITGIALQMMIAKATVQASGGAVHLEQGEYPAICLDFPLQAVPQPGPASGQTPQVWRASLRGQRFLLAEDHPINVTVLKSLLERYGACVEAAQNGKVAFARFEHSPPGFYNAVLMDVRMPEMDGCAATAAIRASRHPDANSIPVVAVTAEAFADDEAKALQAGMDAFVAKPVTLPVLVKALQQAKQRRTQLLACAHKASAFQQDTLV